MKAYMVSKNLTIKDEIKRLKADSKVMMKALRAESLKSRFLLGSHDGIKLKKSLATTLHDCGPWESKSLVI